MVHHCHQQHTHQNNSYDTNDALGRAIAAMNEPNLPHILSSLSDTNVAPTRRGSRPPEHNTSSSRESHNTEGETVSAWNVTTSPMLTCLHTNYHNAHHISPRSSNVRRNKRSFSFDDTHDLKLDQLQIPVLLTKEQLIHHQQKELDKAELLPLAQEQELLLSCSLSGEENLGQQQQQQQRQRQSLVAQQESISKLLLDDDDSSKEGNTISMSILYGMINATIVVPVLMSFGSIIYRDEAFQPYLNVLIKLTVVSGVVHQLCFSTLSTLPFAVGQVQDAGLIFLSSMAGTLVQTCRNQQHGANDDEILLATATVGLSLSTALLGLALVLIGKLKLAQYVQMLPTAVVGGYLAFIGFFCGMSGVGLMAGTSQVTWEVVSSNLEYILPGIFGGIFIYSLVRYLRHMAVLPTCILFLFGLFYFVLWLCGLSVQEATEMGWIAKTDPPPVWYHSWDFLKLDKVLWSALPQLLLTEISMIFVVALSSSLDIAAIELELKRPLDYNRELKMIGISNFVSGITGGYTGSYIFSQSIFSLRAGIRSRLAGFVLAGCEILFLIAPFSILAYVPSFFFGSLLSLICVDLVFEWLIESRLKMTHAEYAVCLSTFALILVTGVEYGIVLGVIFYILCKKIGFDMGDGSNDENGEEENNGISYSGTDTDTGDSTSTPLTRNGNNGHTTAPGTYGAVSAL